MSLRLIKLSVVAILTMALSGCYGLDFRAWFHGHGHTDPVEPETPYSVAINAPDTVQQNTIFTVTATPAENEGAVSYQWTLNDDAISEEETHHTMLPTLGEYTLTVVATDEAGNEDTQSQTVSVVAQTSLNSDFSFGINVSDKEGYALPEVPVTINGATVISDQYGLAQFTGISQTALMLVSASKAGYLTQTYQYSFDAAQENATANLTLQNINPVSHVVDSTVAIDITETELHTKLILDANSFVDAEGNAVTGDVEITITPIDIRAVDNAFLGGGQALTGAGEAVALISTGMADYQFSQNGSAVSLAPGASATIEMDLAVTTGDDGRVFAEGDTIEMWWFDVQTGFWIEDGVGTVQLSDTSETGLKLVAIVDHFTTWNWDYYTDSDRSNITFYCLKDGQPLAANESCQISASSTSINRQLVASSAGATVLNTFPNVTYSVTANTAVGNSLWSGTATLTTVPGNNTVSVDMVSTPTQTGYIQCRIINNSVTSIAPCNTVISSGSVTDQDIDTTGFSNHRASFPYVKGDTLDISATLDSGLNQVKLVDTANLNGTLDIEIVFDIKFGSLQCSATLNGADMQYFPCDALVTDSLDTIIPIWADDFSGTPPKANFTYSKDAVELSIEVASIFDEGRLRQYRDRYYVSGDSTLVTVDLTSEAVAAHVTYDASSANLYTFQCIDDMGSSVDCDITWYNSMEVTIFSGTVSDLSSPDILPTWMSGKVHIEEPLGGFGNARGMDQDLYSSDSTVDTVNRVITFTLVEMPM